MQKIVYSTCHVLIFFVSAFYGYALAMDIGPVRQVYSPGHGPDTPVSSPYIQVKWLPPENGLVDGYYVTFNTHMTHVFDEFNTADKTVEMVRNDTQVTSPDCSGADDVGYYCHIAAFALDTSDKEFIGPTVSQGPFRVDTVAPLLPVIKAPNAVSERMITIRPGALNANEMYISNIGYGVNGQWEPYAEERQWELRAAQGNQIIYVVFRDLAGNTAKASTAVRFDTIGPIPQFITGATLPARSVPIDITIDCGEPVMQFTALDIQTVNCNIQNFLPEQPDVSSRFFMSCVPFTQGSIQLSILANEFQDEAGNDNQASAIFEWIYDTSLPQIYSIPDLMIVENAGSETISFSITNSDAFNGKLTLIAWAEKTTLIQQQDLIINNQGNPLDITMTAGSSQTLPFEIIPKTDQSGETLIHILLSDATGMTAHTAFQLNVWDTPNISPIPDILMDESTVKSIPIILTDGYKQNLVVHMTTSNPALIGPNNMKLIGKAVFNSITFPYNCQTSNFSSITVDLYFEPPPFLHGSVDLTLTAINTKGLSETRAFTLDIQSVNDAPELKVEASATCFEDTSFQMPVSLTDIDQDDLLVTAISSNKELIPDNRMRWILINTEYFNPVPVELGASIKKDLILQLNPTADSFGEATITVLVDDKGFVTEKTFQFTVLSANDPPVSPEAISFTINENVKRGTIVGTIPANDVDNTNLTWTKVHISPEDHFQMNPSSGDIIVNGVMDFESIKVYDMTARVTDEYSHSTTQVSIFITNMNDHPPQLADSFQFSVQENTPIGTIPYIITATDIDDDPLTYSLTWDTESAPFAITRNTGQIWIDDTADYEMRHVYPVIVTVSDGIHSENSPLTITIIDINEKPVISGSPALTIAQGSEYSFQPITTDPDADEQFFYFISSKPKWAEFDPETGRLYGTPENQHVGEWHNIKVTVRDDSHASASLPLFSITVLDTNDPPVLENPIQDISVDKHTVLSFTIRSDTFVDPDPGDTLTYTATEKNQLHLPEWLTFDPDLLQFSGTPGTFDGRVFEIQVTALDSSMAASSDAFLLTVIDHNKKPKIVLPAPEVVFYENNDPVIIDNFARITDEDSPNYDGGILQVFFDRGATPDDHLIIKDHGFGNTAIWLDKNKVFSGQQLIGTHTPGSSAQPLSVTLTHWAKQDAVQALLRNIMYVNNSDNPVDSERRLAFTISDGDGGDSEVVYKSIDVRAVNDHPVVYLNEQIVADTINLPDIKENETITFENDRRLLIHDKDADNGVLTATISATKGVIALDPRNMEHLQNVSGNNTSNITFSGSLEEMNAGLNGLTYTSHLNASKEETIRIYIKDNGHSGTGGGEFVFHFITFNIKEVNEPPLFSPIPPQTLVEDTPAQIAFSVTETDLQNLTLQVNILQPNIICDESVEGPLLQNDYIIKTSDINHAQLVLTVTPCNNQTGDAIISMVITDNEYSVTTQVAMYITPVNDAPVITNQSETVSEDTPLTKALSVKDVENDALQMILLVEPAHGTVTFDHINKTFTYLPEENETEAVFFTYQAIDDTLTSNIGRVDIWINPVNDLPQIEAIENQTLLGSQTRIIEFTVTDIDNSSVDIAAESDNTQLFPNHPSNVSLVQADNSCMLYLTPMSNQFGTARIIISAIDSSQDPVNETFTVLVKETDSLGPVIILNDPQIMQMDQNDEFIEPGYVAIDDIDGNVNESVIIDSTLDTQTPGIYNITYLAEDSKGNVSELAERMVIVNKQSFQTSKISGNIVDEMGDAIGFVNVVVSGQGQTYSEKGIWNGFFEIDIPITFDGSIWRMALSRDGYYPKVVEFFAPRSFDKITLFDKNSNSAEILTGQVFEHQTDGIETVLPQASIRVRAMNNGDVLSSTISDNNGEYTLTVDLRDYPYTFEAAKYGYETMTFDTQAASTIVLMPITTIIIENQTETMVEHQTASKMGMVKMFIKAEPPFSNTDTELKIQPLAGTTNEIKKQYIANGNKYQIIHYGYSDFEINIRADTTEDSDASTGYYVETNVCFKSIQGLSQVSVTKGETPYMITQPFFATQSNSNAFMSIDRGGLSGLEIPRQLNYVIRNYTFPLDDALYDQVVEFSLTDDFGRPIESNDNAICLGITYGPPITPMDLENSTYEIVWADTVHSLLMGNGQATTSFSIYDQYVTFCTSHLSAFGFQKTKPGPEPETSEADSGGGCFLMAVPLPWTGR
ncbi:MAG: hypothetical protein OMM_00614 [Candidatus Magnetoglobus multicellularis str. Araruama]|uniref:Cadherin domain-containing protein n=1 Tax=Candidatus Magnetoglobus multicellularis str. Araruama TaxID=890399 RepID=A0A1V1PG76_9BACT|nr:MAG: hypothetical protein OMM_00614 [Candidatus Magnetoglobus multicellularis str. Araruama]